MRNLLLLASTLTFAAIVNAGANTVTNITFDNFCDGMQLQTADGKIFTSTETGACLQGTTVRGSGVVGGAATVGGGFGGGLTLVVNWAPFEGPSQVAPERLYILQFPFVPGGTWKEYQGTKHCSKGCNNPMNEGKYTLQQ